MNWYFSIRFLTVPFAFLAWFAWALLVKKKPFVLIKGDMIIGLFFIGVWSMLYYFLFL